MPVRNVLWHIHLLTQPCRRARNVAIFSGECADIFSTLQVTYEAMHLESKTSFGGQAQDFEHGTFSPSAPPDLELKTAS